MWLLFAKLLTLAAAASLQSPFSKLKPVHWSPTPHSGERFVGGLMGVHADVTLCLATKHAAIKLSGIPLGGTLQGTARFSDGEGSSVVVDEPLRSSLRRRFVNIVGAKFDRQRDRVYVTVQLPFLLGTQTIMMARAEDEASAAVKAALDDACMPIF